MMEKVENILTEMRLDRAERRSGEHQIHCRLMNIAPASMSSRVASFCVLFVVLFVLPCAFAFYSCFSVFSMCLFLFLSALNYEHVCVCVCVGGEGVGACSCVCVGVQHRVRTQTMYTYVRTTHPTPRINIMCRELEQPLSTLHINHATAGQSAHFLSFVTEVEMQC